jgi:HEAT repeat protein
VSWRSSSASSAVLSLLLAACGARADLWHLKPQTVGEVARLEKEERVAQAVEDLGRPEVRDAAVERLLKLGPAAHSTLSAAVRSGEPEEALTALEIFRRQPTHVEPVAAGLTYSQYAVVRADAARTLADWGEGGEALEWALAKDTDPRVRAEAARGLGLQKRGEPLLRAAVDDVSPRVKVEAIRALVRIGIADARHFFTAAWKRVPEAQQEPQVELARALEPAGPLADRHFIGSRAVTAAIPAVRAAAARLLAGADDPAMATYLLRALSDPDPDVGDAAHASLERLTGADGSDGAIPVERVRWWMNYFGRRN